MCPSATSRGVLVALLACGLLSCGARSAIALPEPCVALGAKRACSNTCGDGTSVCSFGYWQPCEVPIAMRSCTNACGPGAETCQDDAWSSCVVPQTTRPCTSVCGAGTEVCSDATWGPCDAPAPVPPTLQTVVRNFQVGQPDFLSSCCSGGSDPGIVAFELGGDATPTYAGNAATGTLTTAGATSFVPWFHDVSGVNERTGLALPFAAVPGQPGINQFVNEAFFPIDGALFGNQGGSHNYDFTLEAHATISYGGGETFGFSSDDDLWVFVNRRLVIDLGGLHAGVSQSVDLDKVAVSIGIHPGQSYPLDLFYANREPPGAVLTIAIPEDALWSCPSAAQ